MDMLGHATLIVSILIEAAIAAIAVLIALQGRPYVSGLAFTFAVYVLYDLARFFHWDIEEGALPLLFLAATVSALIAVWGLYKERA